MAYTKLHESLVSSTIWREPNHIRVAWITMLAMANKHGEVLASIPGLADICRITIPQMEEALNCFLQPDPYSRTKDFEGRRIEEIDGGWFLLNHPKYRKMASKEDQLEKAAIRQANFKERHRDGNALVTHGNVEVTPDRDIAEAEEESESREQREESSGASLSEAEQAVQQVVADLKALGQHNPADVDAAVAGIRASASRRRVELTALYLQRALRKNPIPCAPQPAKGTNINDTF
jgi:hypothetical protein